MLRISGLERGFPGGSTVKNPPANAGDMGSVPDLGRSPGEGSGNPLQYSFLGNPIDRGTWQATMPGAAKSWILSTHLWSRESPKCVGVLGLLRHQSSVCQDILGDLI